MGMDVNKAKAKTDEHPSLSKMSNDPVGLPREAESRRGLVPAHEEAAQVSEFGPLLSHHCSTAARRPAPHGNVAVGCDSSGRS
jgi:hypothetical protein